MARHGGELLRATASVINYALQHGKPPRLHLDSFHQALRQKRATFVTLRRDGKLRGCIGTVEAVRPLIADAAFNAYRRSEEHTSEFQSLMRISYAVFCLKKKNTKKKNTIQHNTNEHTTKV